MIFAATLLAALFIARGCGDEMVSQCVTDGSVLELDCPVTDFEEYDDYVGWTLPSDYDYDEDISGFRRVSMTATRSSASGYDVEELTCSLNDMYYHAILLITDVQNPVLPIQPSLTKGDGQTLNVTWENPLTTFEDKDDVYYNYSIIVNITDSHQQVIPHDVEAHVRTASRSIDLTGLECSRVDVGISLPGNCRDQEISGYLWITPQQFQEDVTSDVLFTYDGLWTQVLIRFTPPELCPLQRAHYMFTFDDGDELWSTSLVTILNSTRPVEESMDDRTRLQRERNYTLRVTVITEYANVSSTTEFNTHPRQRPINIGPVDLRVIGHNKSMVQVAWRNPPLTAVPSLLYEITVRSINPDSEIISPIQKAFLLEENPLIFIDLSGYECVEVRITVSVFGEQDEAQSVNDTLPSYSTAFVQDIYVETSFYADGSIREAEISFKPPLVCEGQEASYIIMISGGNATWFMSDGPVIISDPQQLVKREVETGLVLNTNYTVTVTVFTKYANISSSKQFRFEADSGSNTPVVTADELESTSSPESISSSLVGGVVGGVVCLLAVVLLCGFGAGMIAVYLLRQRKEKRQKKGERQTGRCMVTNPIYGGSDDFYEELPDNTTSHHQITATAASNAPASTAPPPPPAVPPPRKTDPQELSLELSESEKEAIKAKLNGRPSSLHEGLSTLQQDEAEDCYTVMSPAGTLTVLPRNRHSAASLGASAPWPMAGTL